MIHPKVVEFVEFCERMPADRHYDWDDGTRCALGQFNGFDHQGWADEFQICNELARIGPREFGPLARRVKSHFDDRMFLYVKVIEQPISAYDFVDG